MPGKHDQFIAKVANYWLCEARDGQSGSDLLASLRHPNAPLSELDFKSQLADAIMNKRFTVEEYEELTDLDFENTAQVAADLSELWRLMYGNEPIALPDSAT